MQTFDIFIFYIRPRFLHLPQALNKYSIDFLIHIN